MAQHLLGHLEICDHAVAKRPRCTNVGRCAADHLPRLLTNRLHLAAPLIDRDHRRLEQDDALAPPKDDRIRSTEINRQLPSRTAPRQPHAQRPPKTPRLTTPLRLPPRPRRRTAAPSTVRARSLRVAYKNPV